MINRRLFMGSAMLVSLPLSVKASAVGDMPTQAPLAADPSALSMVDENVVAANVLPTCNLRIARGAFIQPHHVRWDAQQSMAAILSPANAALLAEYVRFTKGVTIQDHLLASLDLTIAGAIRPDARLVTIRQLRRTTA